MQGKSNLCKLVDTTHPINRNQIIISTDAENLVTKSNIPS
jgi:hypothetical protein